MPRNEQGVYFLPAGNPVVTGTLVRSDWANPTMDDIGLALTGSLPRDGSAGMTGPLSLIADAVNDLEAVPKQQVGTILDEKFETDYKPEFEEYQENCATSEANAASSAQDAANCADQSYNWSQVSLGYSQDAEVFRDQSANSALSAANSETAAAASEVAAAQSASDASDSADDAANAAKNISVLQEDFVSTGQQIFELTSFQVDADNPATLAMYADGLKLMDAFPCDAVGNPTTGMTSFVNAGQVVSSGQQVSVHVGSPDVFQDVSDLVDDAENAAIAAAASETAAGISEANAAASETNAAASELSAANDAASASADATAAGISEVNAAASAAAALVSETNAAASEANAASSEAIALANANATVYDPLTTYNYPDVTIAVDGNNYRCLGSNVVGDNPVGSTTGNWIRITTGTIPPVLRSSNFSIKANEHIQVDTSGGPVTVTLPANPQVGERVKLTDYAGTWKDNNCILARNGNNIMRLPEDNNLNVNNLSIDVEYFDVTKGWGYL